MIYFLIFYQESSGTRYRDEHIEIFKGQSYEYVRIYRNYYGTIIGARIVYDLNTPDKRPQCKLLILLVLVETIVFT